MGQSARLPLSDTSIIRSFLYTQGGEWVTAARIRAFTGVTPIEVRVACQAQPHVFVSSTEGYKLATQASKYEIQHCVTTLISRSEKMLSRAAALSSHLA